MDDAKDNRYHPATQRGGGAHWDLAGVRSPGARRGQGHAEGNAGRLRSDRPRRGLQRTARLSTRAGDPAPTASGGRAPGTGRRTLWTPDRGSRGAVPDKPGAHRGRDRWTSDREGAFAPGGADRSGRRLQRTARLSTRAGDPAPAASGGRASGTGRRTVWTPDRGSRGAV